MVGGKVKKLPKKFLVPNELKSTKRQHVVFCFYPPLGVGGSKANVDKFTFFEPFPKPIKKSNHIGLV